MNNLDRGMSALETLLTTRGLPLLDTDQRTALAAWPGWGVFAPAFDSDARVREDVAGIVDKIGAGTMADVIKATATSFYTPKWLVKRLFSLLSAHGTTSGRVLEPGCGNGRFMMVEPGYEWTGVEADPITAMIASSLNPEATILTGKLEDIHLSPGSFDAVIGNVPFAAGAVHDRFGHYATTLHDYFLRRSIAALKPGGIAALIISTGFMERPVELDDARIVGAVRLPSGTFVGTDVPADIIVVRKDDGQDAPSVNTEPMGYGMKTLTRSPYFAQNPQMVAGEHRESSHYAVDFTVHSDSPGEDSVAAIERLAEVVRALPTPLAPAEPVFEEIVDDQVDGSFRIAPDGSITRRDMGQDVAVRPSAELTALIGLRDLAIELIRADATAAREARDFDAATINADLRARVLAAYDSYVQAHGPLNRGTMHEGPEDPETGEPKLSWRRPTMGGFSKDPEYMTVMALENYDQDHGTASPAAILTRAVNRPARIVDHVENAAEALSVSRGEVGRLDLDRVASLTGRDLHTVTTELADLGLIYPDPVTGGRWTLADDYLSGDVRSKLSLARTAAKVDPTYLVNVTALEQAMPDQAGPENIIVRLGAPWVPAEYIRDFTSQVLGLVNGLSITAMPAIGAWEVSEKRYSRGDDNFKWATYSTSKANARDILNAALNAGTITIWDEKYVDGKVRKVRNVPETMAAQAKMDLMNEEMSTWVWEDADRADDLVRIFNETFRSHAPRSHSGDHLTFPDLADDAHELWPWQRSVIDRVVSTPAVMCAHPVGSGKAQPMDSLILTPTGFRRMGDFLVGDEVIAPDGSTTTVTGVFPQGPKDNYRVSFSDGTSAECNDEHLWNVMSINAHYDRSTTWHTKTLRQIMDEGITTSRGQNKWLTPLPKAADFDCGEDRLIDPYLLGLLLGDGNVTTSSVYYSTADEELAVAFAAALPEGTELVKGNYSARPYDYRVKTETGKKHTNPLLRALRDMHIAGSDSRSKFVPRSYKEAPVKVRLAVLQGLMDTDGYVATKTGRGVSSQTRLMGSSVEFASGSAQLIADVSWIVRSLGGTVTGNTGQRVINGATHYRITMKLPPEFNPFRLTRKSRIYVPAQHYMPRRAITSIEKIGVKPMQCISVAHKDHLYVTDNFVVTHNTLSILGSVMSLRRFGIANKPMVTVPGHLLEQISREARQAFPTGKFLIATKEDLSPSRRRLFAARCATGDWDAVILTHESFTSIPAPAWAQEQYIVGEQDSLLSRVGDVHAKKVSAAIRSMERKVAKARENISDDSALTFDQLGIDYIAVDEAAQFKRLPISSRADGFSLGASKRALDLLIKVRMISSDRPHVALFTGTPWSNSLAETFVWQTYLQPERLRQMNVDTFDAWAAMFVQYETSVEVSPEGSSFRMNTRPSRVSNVRTLMGMFSEVCDLLDSSSLPIKRPDAQYHTVKVEPGPAQSDFVAHLAERADLLRAGGVSPKDDNMLLICGQGRTVALDPRLVDLDEDSPKIEAVARRIVDVHERTSDIDYGRGRPGAFQLALCDLGTPGKGGSRTYGRLKKRLVELGMKPASIRFVHEAPSDKARAALFAACRDGSVSVLIGSTSKVGIGTNIQDRLVALHHVDAPWRPSDVVQREGRGLRPGNLNDAVEIYRYVTEGTFDAYTWQTLQRKAAFIHSLVNGHVDVDTMDDIGEQVLSFGEVKAAAAGNPLLLEQATLQSRARTLRMLRASHRKHVTSMHTRASTLKREASSARNLARAITEATHRMNLSEYETSDETAQWVITSALSGDHLGQYGLNVSRGEGNMTWRIVRTEQRVEVRYITRSITREVLLDFTISVDVLTDDEALDRVKAGMTKRVRKLAGEPDRLLAAAREKEDERASLEVAAESMTFEDDGELTRVLNDLARIDAEIAGHADPERELVAA